MGDFNSRGGAQSLSAVANVPRELRTALLVGETGCGKSTLVNSLANYFLAGTLDRPKIVIPNKVYRQPTERGFANHSEANIDDPTVSQTKKCAMYEFVKDNVVYRFIDTPGLSDFAITGTHYGDDETVNAILTAAGQAGELQAIILIINGSVPKLTVNLKSALRRIASSYPDVLLRNMLAVFTNSDFRNPNFDVKLLPNKPMHHFTMNNAAFSSRLREWDQEELKMQRLYWEKGMRKIDEMVSVINRLPAQQTQACSEIVGNRSKIQSTVHRVITEIDRQQLFMQQMREIQQQINVLQQKQQHIQLNANRSTRDLAYLAAQEKVEATASESAARRDSGQLAAYLAKLQEAVSEASTDSTTEEIDQIINFAQRWKDCRSKLDIRGSRLTDPQQAREVLDKKGKSHSHSQTSAAEEEFAVTRSELERLQARLKALEEQQWEASERISKGQAEVERTCRELQATCREFNFTAELAQTRDALRGELQHLKTEEGKRKAVAYLGSLAELGDVLNQQVPRAKQYSKRITS